MPWSDNIQQKCYGLKKPKQNIQSTIKHKIYVSLSEMSVSFLYSTHG